MTESDTPRPCTSYTAGSLNGSVVVPGDKSISHRSLIIGALAVGDSGIDGLPEGEDVLATAAALRRMGADICKDADGIWHVHGVGIGGLREPADVIDLGNAGTGARLLSGLLATHGFTSVISGDASLRSRPMARVVTPLTAFGARFETRSENRLPMAIIGATDPVPVSYRVPVPSAQVKSAILLAGLNTPGITEVIEPVATRDHTERMLRHFGADLQVSAIGEGTCIRLTGQPELTLGDVTVPADPSSAAFPVVAALLHPGSEVILPNVCMNPLRTGLFTTLREMGADIRRHRERDQAGEPVADLVVTGRGVLQGVEVPAARAPSMIDEYPILAVLAAFAQGTTVMRGLKELRVKESDRLAAVAAGLTANGVPCEVIADDLVVHGVPHRAGGTIPGGARVTTHFDHRIAMSFLVMGLATENPVGVDDVTPIATSFPAFPAVMTGLGARFEAVGDDDYRH